jgi:hypothetical protein
MTTLTQDNVNDILLDNNGELRISSGNEAYGFILADAIRTLRGELQLNIESGIPYQDTVWEGRRRINLWKDYVTKKIISYDFVESITSFIAEMTSDSTLKYTIVVRTNDGNITVEG